MRCERRGKAEEKQTCSGSAGEDSVRSGAFLLAKNVGREMGKEEKIVFYSQCHTKMELSDQKLNIGQVWWFMPVIPALWEAEVGGLLEVRSSRPAWPTW